MDSAIDRHVCIVAVEQAPTAANPVDRLTQLLQVLGVRESQPWAMAFTVHQPPKKIVQASRLCMIDTSDEPEFLFAAAYERSGDSPAAMAPQPAAAALRPEISRISKPFRLVIDTIPNMYRLQSRVRCEGRCATLNGGLRVCYGAMAAGARQHLMLEVSATREGLSFEQFRTHAEGLVAELGLKQPKMFTERSVAEPTSSGNSAASSTPNLVYSTYWHRRATLILTMLSEAKFI